MMGHEVLEQEFKLAEELGKVRDEIHIKVEELSVYYREKAGYKQHKH
jgi:hypothetical protein